MEEVRFNFDGFITPDRGIEVSHDQLANLFIEGFPGEERRRLLWERYLQWLADFRSTVSEEVEIWIDGSYVTKRKTPGDIDIVVLIDYLVWQETESIFHNLKSQYGNMKSGLDLYYIVVYPENHVKYHLMQANKAEWRHLFTRTRPNRRRTVFKKGFIIVHYERDN